jgi:urease accessory protein
LEKFMKSLFGQWAKFTAVAALALGAGVAQAHTGHGTTSFFEGLVHPFGLDHLLAMVAVGVWSVSALPVGKAWWGPTTFLLSLVLSAMLGAEGFTVAYLEHAISISVVIFGLMLIFVRRGFSAAAGLGLIALAASLHGLAHGAEAPESGFAGYAAGFMLTTTVLHLGGVATGLGIRRFLATQSRWVTGGLGALFGGAGVYLLQQL